MSVHVKQVWAVSRQSVGLEKRAQRDSCTRYFKQVTYLNETNLTRVTSESSSEN